MGIKLIACDVDGTLLGRDLVLSVATRDAVGEASRRGVKFCIATGRMYRSALPFARALGLSTPMIAYNGALMKDTATGEVYSENPLDLGLAREIMGLCRDNSWYMQKYVDDNLYVKEINDFARAYSAQTGVEVLEEGSSFFDLTVAPYKMLLIAAPIDAAVIREELAMYFGDRLSITSSNPRFVELVQPGVNKGRALAELVRKFSLEREEVMAIGDAHNDLEMIAYAGTGVAMGNAPPDVQATADFVSASTEEDGVALALRKFVLD